MTVVIRGGALENGGKLAGALAHAEGYNTQASGSNSHAEGVNGQASGNSAHAEGGATTASGAYAHAEGTNTTASASSAHAEGGYTAATASSAHAEGYGTTASGVYSHAEGYSSVSSGYYSHAEGYFGVAPRYAQWARAAFSAGTISSTSAQYSVFLIGCLASATSASSTEMFFDGSGPAYPANASYTNCLTIPLKTTMMCRFDVVARQTTSGLGSAFGMGWTGTFLVGRGNSAGTYAVVSNTVGSGNTTNQLANITPTHKFNTDASDLQLQVSINAADNANNYLKMAVYNNGTGFAWAVQGVLHCTEVTTSI